MTALLGILGMATLMIMAKTSLRVNKQTYQELVTHILGKRAAFIAQLLLVVYTAGTCVLYLQIIGDGIANPVRYFAGIEHCGAWYANRRFLIALFTIVVCTPLSLIKDMKNLGYASAAGVSFVLYTVGFVFIDAMIFEANPNHIPVVPPIESGINPSIALVTSFPVIMFAFMCHVSFVPIAAEMENPTPKRFATVVILAMFGVFGLYIMIGVGGYLRFGPGVDANVLNNYPPNYVPAIIARLGCCHLWCCYRYSKYQLCVWISRFYLCCSIPHRVSCSDVVSVQQKKAMG